jgi:hypothetical protein
MNIKVTLMYLGFFALIGFAIYFSGRLLPLWALLLAPSYKSDDKDLLNYLQQLNKEGEKYNENKKN